MRTLTNKEIHHISGGYDQNIYDGIMVSGAFSAIFSMAGAVGGIFWYLEATSHTPILSSTIAATVGLTPAITLPIALFAGVGMGGCAGAVVGAALYYAGIVTRPT
ncbi:MAG: hypothetical protein BGO43_10105 [Gammaproteobacteria bacterium 39-13]|nr:hypothetical protein [Gammaproteobacteria bacterium]OJV89109.1 MAG: hypothetical protein BGO43_10105 [Gammaproteobacteria bacterium 39-13]